MALRLYSGGILAAGGALATSDACCCDIDLGYCYVPSSWFSNPPSVGVSATVFIPDVGNPAQCAAGGWATTMTLSWVFQAPPSTYYFSGCGDVQFSSGQTGSLQVVLFCDNDYGHYAMATIASHPCNAAGSTCMLPGGSISYTTFAGVLFGPAWNNVPQNVIFNFPFGIQAVCQLTLHI